MKKNKKITSPKRKKFKKTSVRERLLHHLARKYTANLEPGVPGESLLIEKKDEPVINPNK